MTNHPHRSRNYAYEVVCTDDQGWGDCDSLWSATYADRADRIFATAAEAHEVRRELLDAGCWYTEDDDGHRTPCVPTFRVDRISVYEGCWSEDEDVQDRLVEIHGRSIEFAAMPEGVARFLVAKFTGSAEAWSQISASLVGASSATHTAAARSGIAASRVQEIRDMLAARAAPSGSISG